MDILFPREESFDTEINSGLISNTSDSQTNILQSLTGGITATAVDIGASIWNSLPGTDEVQTEDLLGRISGDALRIYQENPDTIKTASLIGGAILPGGLAVKGMQAMRNGSKAVNWFTTAGKKRDVAAAAELFANGAKDSTKYKQLIWGMRGKTVANQTADAVAAELAILGTMNAHSYMEDYMDDGLSNFALSVALGGGIGSTFGLISDAYQLRKATSAVEASTFETILGAVKPVGPAMPEATKVQTLGLNVKNLNNIIEGRKAAGKTEFDDLTYGYALKTQREMQKEQLEIFDAMLDSELKGLDQAAKLRLMDTVNSGEGFWGVEKIKSITAPELMSMGKMNNLLMNEPVLKATNRLGDKESVESVFFPETGQFGTKKDVQHYGGMSALNLTEKDLIKSLPKNSSVPNFEYSFEALAKSTPAVEAEYAAWITKFSKLDDDAMQEYLAKSLVSASDIPQVQALAARINQSDVLRNTAKVKIADRAQQAEAIIDEVNIQRTLGGTPVKYQEAAERLLNNSTVSSKYDIMQTRGQGTAHDMLRSWKAGSGVLAMHKAAVAYFARGYAKNARNTDDMALAEKFAEVYESAESIQLRKDLLSTLADADGKIYAYRGVNAPKIFGQNPVESMAVTVGKAGQFTGASGKTMLYKIDVDDVVAAIKDIGPSGDNIELLVRASAREAEAVLSTDGRIAFRKQMENSLKKPAVAYEARLGDLNDYLSENKFSLVTSLIAKGYPPAVIAKRANMPETSVNQFIASARDLDAFEALPDINTFKKLEDVEAANAVTNRPLQLSGNLKKEVYTKGAANLNARTLTNIDGAFKSMTMMNSASAAVRKLGQFFFSDMKEGLDVARMNLAKITNESAGNRFITSADQAARNMGELGPIFSMVGKQIQNIANEVETATLKPISEFMSTVSKDVASLTEYSVAHNLNAGLSGWRIYKDKQFWQKVEKLGEDGKPVTVLEPVTYNGKPFTVVTEGTDQLLTQMQNASKELYELSSVSRRITGSANLSDIGLWIPSFNPVDKFIAYVHNRASDTTQMLWGKTKAELDDAIRTFTPELQKDPNLLIVTKDNQAWWSKLNGRLDTVNMKRADVGMTKTGTGASAIPKISTDILAETAGGYQHYINAQVRNLSDLALSDITDTLDNFSAINKSATEGQTLSFVRSITQAPKDAAASMKNLLIGNPSLGEYEGWRSINKSFEIGLSMGANAVGKAFELAAAPRFKNPFSSKKPMAAEDMKGFNYDKFSEELNKAGVVNPFEVYDRAVAIEKYGVSTLLDTPDTSKRIVTASNALAATIALRFGELAHPIVNLMSMPILTSLANSKAMPETFMGIAKGTAKVPTTQIMFEGVRAMNSPRYASLSRKWEELGYYKPLVSEASEVLRASRAFEKGAISTIENALDSSFVAMLSKPADYSEALSRKMMMHTGAVLAKRLYPELSDNGVTIFARDFMDKALGNYTASQRPVFFQGTMGVAMGLFQTYMLTLAQGVYRAAELKDFATLGKAAMAQTSIFGTSSLPGFDPISKAIAENFSDDNVDLTTGTFRALGDTGASYTLYGLPSNLTGAAFYTRGDIDPRFPNVLAGADQVVAVNMGIQMAQAIGSVGKAVASGDQDTGQAILQALSLQSMSRPLARGAELLSDYSMTRAGNTVQNAEEVWSFTGVAARVMALRPMEEAKLREAQHLNQHYGSVDRDNRQAVVNKLRTAIRNGSVDSERIAEWAEEYFRNNGTPTGWRSAYKNAIAKTDMSGKEALMDKLRDDDPLNFMINNLD